MSAVTAVGLAETRAALAAGATPSAALLAGFAGDPLLAPMISAVRLGTPLSQAAADLSTGDPATDLFVRALAVAEDTGAGAEAAIQQALAAAHDDALVQRLLRSRSAQARGTATLLAVLPLVGWLGTSVLGGGTAGFLRTPLGVVTTALAVTLAASGGLWSRRLIRRAAEAGLRADPLHRPSATLDRRRAAAVGGPALVVAWLLAGAAAGVIAASVAVALTLPRRRRAAGAGGATETIELVAVALAAGLPPSGALAAVAPLAPGAAREPLATAARRLRSGWTPGEALAGTGLQCLGEVLEATQRWGAPAQDALAALAADLRAQRRSAAEEAAERAQLLLVFPTTLLTLPAFVLAVVPPLLWGAFAG